MNSSSWIHSSPSLQVKSAWSKAALIDTSCLFGAIKSVGNLVFWLQDSPGRMDDLLKWSICRSKWICTDIFREARSVQECTVSSLAPTAFAWHYPSQNLSQRPVHNKLRKIRYKGMLNASNIIDANAEYILGLHCKLLSRSLEKLTRLQNYSLKRPLHLFPIVRGQKLLFFQNNLLRCNCWPVCLWLIRVCWQLFLPGRFCLDPIGCHRSLA